MYKDDEGIKIDEKKLRRLQNGIYLIERTNLKKKPPASDNEIIERIRKLIEEEVKKCY